MFFYQRCIIHTFLLLSHATICRVNQVCTLIFGEEYRKSALSFPSVQSLCFGIVVDVCQYVLVYYSLCVSTMNYSPGYVYSTSVRD